MSSNIASTARSHKGSIAVLLLLTATILYIGSVGALVAITLALAHFIATAAGLHGWLSSPSFFKPFLAAAAFASVLGVLAVAAALPYVLGW